MSYDELIECTRCGSNATYRQEITPEISIELCYGCGFKTTSVMKVGSKMLEDQIQTLPELYRNLIDEDEEGKVWIPSYLDIPGKGIIFAEGKSRDVWGWKAVKKTDDNPKLHDAKAFGIKGFIDALDYLEIKP